MKDKFKIIFPEDMTDKTYAIGEKALNEMWKDEALRHRKEIERLNNIINELEKILIIEISEAGFHYEKIKEDTLQWIFNELQELKGVDKE